MARGIPTGIQTTQRGGAGREMEEFQKVCGIYAYPWLIRRSLSDILGRCKESDTTGATIITLHIDAWEV